MPLDGAAWKSKKRIMVERQKTGIAGSLRGFEECNYRMPTAKWKCFFQYLVVLFFDLSCLAAKPAILQFFSSFPSFPLFFFSSSKEHQFVLLCRSLPSLTLWNISGIGTF